MNKSEDPEWRAKVRKSRADVAVILMRYHFEWGEVEEARNIAADALAEGCPISETLRDLIVKALRPQKQGRGRPRAPYPRDWFPIGMDYDTLRGQGKKARECYEVIASMPKYRNISAETVKKRVKYYKKTMPTVWADLERLAGEREGS